MADVAEAVGGVDGAAGGGEFDAGGGQAGGVEVGVVVVVGVGDVLGAEEVEVDHVDVAVAIEVGDLGFVGGAVEEVVAEEVVVGAVDASVAVEVGEVPAVAEDLPLAVGGVLVALHQLAGVTHHAHDVVVGVVEGVEEAVAAVLGRVGRVVVDRDLHQLINITPGPSSPHPLFEDGVAAAAGGRDGPAAGGVADFDDGLALVVHVVLAAQVGGPGDASGDAAGQAVVGVGGVKYGSCTFSSPFSSPPLNQ